MSENVLTMFRAGQNSGTACSIGAIFLHSGTEVMIGGKLILAGESVVSGFVGEKMIDEPHELVLRSKLTDDVKVFGAELSFSWMLTWVDLEEPDNDSGVLVLAGEQERDRGEALAFRPAPPRLIVVGERQCKVVLG